MGEAFSDKEVAFSLRRVIPRQGEDCSFIKVSEWLNAIAEHCESAHHHSMTGKKEERRQGCRKQGKMRDEFAGGIEKKLQCRIKRIIFQNIYMIKLNSRQTKRQKGNILSCSCLSLHSTVWVVVNIFSPPLPDGVKGISCSPGQRRPHFYMWTAVNSAEWHTTKVGCAAALSLLNGTLAFSFARVSGTHTSQVFAPKMCGSVCVLTST